MKLAHGSVPFKHSVIMLYRSFILNIVGLHGVNRGVNPDRGLLEPHHHKMNTKCVHQTLGAHHWITGVYGWGFCLFLFLFFKFVQQMVQKKCSHHNFFFLVWFWK